MLCNLRSWIEVAATSHFPIQNIPFGVFVPNNSNVARGGTAIGDFALDLSGLYGAGLLQDVGLNSNVFASDNLNEFLKYPKTVWSQTRNRIISLLQEDGDSALKNNQLLLNEVLFPLNQVTMLMPFEVKEYTDFYASREHATNVGIMFRGVENALQPNWLHVPIGYHGRASSVVVSGTDIIRPCGQLQKNAAEPKDGSVFGPSRLLDFELELGAVIGGAANPLGQPLTLEEAEKRIFGIVLLNDWSARDVQAWEYVPLGPFTAKNFATSISPWIVTIDALEEFRCSSSEGATQSNPVPLDYLRDPDYHRGFFDISLEVQIADEEDNLETQSSVVSRTSSKYLYWNMKQQLAHHSVTGASMRAGDLLGTGTISGKDASAFGSMLELSWRGAKEVPLVNSSKPGNVRKFLKDGDTVVMTGFAQAEGYRVGFGEVKGKILPARVPK